jgi:hypothetical protein
MNEIRSANEAVAAQLSEILGTIGNIFECFQGRPDRRTLSADRILDGLRIA